MTQLDFPAVVVVESQSSKGQTVGFEAPDSNQKVISSKRLALQKNTIESPE